MNAAKEAALLMSSLSIYRGITLRTVAKAYYELLCSVNKPVFEFAQAWGNFVSLLCERNCIDNFSGYLTETALYDENIFSRAAAAAYILAIIFYIPLYCRNLNYTFDKKIITVKKGVLYKRTSVLPVSSVQYCVVMQGLLQKRFRRCSVFLMLAGSFIIISQLKLSDGEALVSALREMQSGGDENGK